MEIENNICPNCGAAMVDDLSYINAWHCQYCGTTIDKMITRHFIIEHPKVTVAHIRNRFALDHICAYECDGSLQEFTEHIKQNMCYRLAERILENVEFETEKDLYTNSYIVNAKIRIVDKDFRF